MRIPKSEATRHIIFIIGILAAALMAYGPLRDLFRSRLYRDYHSIIPFIPIISIYLLYLKRKKILEEVKYAFASGGAVIIAGIVFFVLGFSFGDNFNQNDYATVMTFSSLVLLLGAFIFIYGLKAFKTALFPLLFLLLTVPFPSERMEELVVFFQKGSTEFANVLFWLSQAPYYREGFNFHLPNVSIEVAPECSGIRSALSLFITALLAGYLFLDSWWRRVILIVFVIPVTMFKNGIRITTLTLLGNYIDPRILQSSLHREGGIPFFVVALLLMAPVLYFLRKRERVTQRESVTKNRISNKGSMNK